MFLLDSYFLPSSSDICGLIFLLRVENFSCKKKKQGGRRERKRVGGREADSERGIEDQ